MSDTTLAALWRVSSILQCIGMVAVALITAALGITLGLSLAGLLPGLALNVALSDGQLLTVGPLAHGIAFLIALVLLTYMPANWRMRRLEAGHRSFRIGMQDVTRAYEVAHAADREGLFKLSAEYDAVRERLEFLANHPDLGHLEPGILEVAAQMSRVSEDLARVYSDEAVGRAQRFLKERQEEVARMDERIERALAVTRDIRKWNERVSMDEAVATSRIEQLEKELAEILPDLGIGRETVPSSPAKLTLLPQPDTRDIAAE